MNPAQAQSLGGAIIGRSRGGRWPPCSCRAVAGDLPDGPDCLGPCPYATAPTPGCGNRSILLGFNAYFLLPVLTVGILLGWHYVLRQPWHVSRIVLYGMAGECLGLAAASGFFGACSDFSCSRLPIRLAWASAVFWGRSPVTWGRHLRRIALSADPAELRDWPVGLDAGEPRGQRDRRVVLTSLLFSAAHYVGPCGDPFRWLTFLFRFLAGVFFAVLFRYRGFGIAAGTHAFYDVLVGLLTVA